jgi:hypothetical protein
MDEKQGSDLFEKESWKNIIKSTESKVKYLFLECKLEINFSLKTENG